jgi:hypothetical protein
MKAHHDPSTPTRRLGNSRPRITASHGVYLVRTAVKQVLIMMCLDASTAAALKAHLRFPEQLPLPLTGDRKIPGSRLKE